MPQWNWKVWALVSTVANQTKVTKITKPINLTQPALFVAQRATLLDNSGTIHPGHPLLMLPTTHKDLRDVRYTLQGDITAPRHPTNQNMPTILNQMTTKHPTTLLMFQVVVMYHQCTIHHQNLRLVLLNIPQLPGTFQKTEIGTTRTLKPTRSRESIFFLWFCCFWSPSFSYILQWAHEYSIVRVWC